MGSSPSFVDIQAAPWVLRLSRVLKPYRGWPDAKSGTRWASWVKAINTDDHIRATTSTDELYLDSYERYARKFLSTSKRAKLLTVADDSKRIGRTRPCLQMQSMRDVVFLSYSTDHTQEPKHAFIQSSLHERATQRSPNRRFSLRAHLC